MGDNIKKLSISQRMKQLIDDFVEQGNKRVVDLMNKDEIFRTFYGYLPELHLNEDNHLSEMLLDIVINALEHRNIAIDKMNAEAFLNMRKESYRKRKVIKEFGIDAPFKLACAIIAHEANRAYCQAIGDNSQLPWEESPQWQKDSAIKGVEFIIQNKNSKPEDSHNSWLKEKEKDGWKYGEIKNPETKEHPCFVPYSQLPVEQKAKDYIFSAIAKAFIKIEENDIFRLVEETFADKGENSEVESGLN